MTYRVIRSLLPLSWGSVSRPYLFRRQSCALSDCPPASFLLLILKFWKRRLIATLSDGVFTRGSHLVSRGACHCTECKCQADHLAFTFQLRALVRFQIWKNPPELARSPAALCSGSTWPSRSSISNPQVFPPNLLFEALRLLLRFQVFYIQSDTLASLIPVQHSVGLTEF